MLVGQRQERDGPATETDIASYVMYPKVFEDYKKFVTEVTNSELKVIEKLGLAKKKN